MKLFISWSGEISRKVATILKEWIPSVVQDIVPYMSAEDIQKGARWSGDVSRELEGTSYGILCITRENIDAPWISFEAGALSKSVDKSRVAPFLFGIKRSELDKDSPLLQFQSTIFQKKDFKQLIEGLNAACEEGIPSETSFDKIFEVWWPHLRDDLDKLSEEIAKTESGIESTAKEVDDSPSAEAIEEILELVRSQQKILSSPQTLLPMDYLEKLLTPTLLSLGHPADQYLRQILDELRDLLDP